MRAGPRQGTCYGRFRYRIHGNHIRGRLPVIRITALNEDGTFRWEGGQGAEGLLTECMRQKSAEVEHQASGLPTPSVAPGTFDGVYAGAVCYGPSANDPARCYRSRAIVRDGRIVGQWDGRDPGVTVKLAGNVSGTGEVKIEMHAERVDGNVFGRANLSGTVENGRLEAKGSFSSGRTVSFNSRLNAPGHLGDRSVDDMTTITEPGRDYPRRRGCLSCRGGAPRWLPVLLFRASRFPDPSFKRPNGRKVGGGVPCHSYMRSGRTA